MVPEIDLVLAHGTLGGRFTTLEGILEQVYEELTEKVFTGDSAAGEDRVPFEAFLGKLKEVCCFSFALRSINTDGGDTGEKR